MFQFHDARFTHMPFAATDSNGVPGLFCCIMIHGIWKIHHLRNGQWCRVNTRLPEDATECAPVAEFDDGIWKISFVAGGCEKDRRFRLYRMYGLESTPIPMNFADAGFVWKERTVFAPRRGPIIIVEPDQITTVELNDAEFIYRLSCDPFLPNRILISGQKYDRTIFSRAYQVGRDILFDIVDANNTPAYKCALYQNRCFYAERGDEFEQRHIVEAKQPRWIELDAKQFVSENNEHVYARSELMEFE